MASVQLKGLWIHVADDLSDHVQIRGLTDATLTPSHEGEVRELSGGRLVYRSRPTRRTSYQVTVRVEDRATREQLAAWVGTPVMVRDGIGQLVWGVYRSLQSGELGGGVDQRDVSLTVESLSLSAEV